MGLTDEITFEIHIQKIEEIFQDFYRKVPKNYDMEQGYRWKVNKRWEALLEKQCSYTYGLKIQSQ